MKAFIFLLVASQAVAQSTTDCDRGGVLTPRGVGPLTIGMTPNSLTKVCRVIGRRGVAEYSMMIFDVRVGLDTVQAFEQQGRIAWIEVHSAGIRTRDSVGVGSGAAVILQQPDLHSGPGDGTNTFMLAPRAGAHCGLVFWLDSRTAEMLNAARGDRLRLLAMRGAGTIIQIDIHGECRAGNTP